MHKPRHPRSVPSTVRRAGQRLSADRRLARRLGVTQSQMVLLLWRLQPAHPPIG